MKTWTLRLGWFALLGALLAHKDMCLGGGSRPPEPTQEAGPSDADTDGQHDARLYLSPLPAYGCRTRTPAEPA